MPLEKQLALAERLAQSDPEPALKAFAAATVDYLHSPAATQPATQPATAPAGFPAPAAPGEQRIGGSDAAPIPSGASVPSESKAGAGAGTRGG